MMTNVNVPNLESAKRTIKFNRIQIYDKIRMVAFLFCHSVQFLCKKKLKSRSEKCKPKCLVPKRKLCKCVNKSRIRTIFWSQWRISPSLHFRTKCLTVHFYVGTAQCVGLVISWRPLVSLNSSYPNTIHVCVCVCVCVCMTTIQRHTHTHTNTVFLLNCALFFFHTLGSV